MSTSKDFSPPILSRRRRSSITISRKSIAPIVVSHTQEVSLRQYVAETKHELEDWFQLARQRNRDMKTSEAVLEEVTSNPPSFTVEMMRGDLESKDLEFIANQPDYAKFSRDVRLFAETVGCLKTRMQCVQSRIEGHNLLVKARLDALAKNVCEFNDTAPTWYPKNKEEESRGGEMKQHFFK